MARGALGENFWMIEFLKLWSVAIAAAGGVFLIVDMIWLRFAVPMLYRPALGDLLAEQFRMGPALVFYLLYVAAMVWFAVRPGMALGVPHAVCQVQRFGDICLAMACSVPSPAVTSRHTQLHTDYGRTRDDIQNLRSRLSI